MPGLPAARRARFARSAVPQRRRTASGVTLVELAVTIAVAAILVALAAPALQATLRKNRLDSTTSEFVSALTRARSEAVRLGQPVCVQSTSATAGDWTPGWTLVAAAGCPNPAAAVIQQGSALPAPLTQWGSVAALGFDATGRLIGTGGAVNFIFCADGADPTQAAGVTVALSGRVRVADNDKTTGRPIENDGAPMAGCQQP